MYPTEEPNLQDPMQPMEPPVSTPEPIDEEVAEPVCFDPSFGLDTMEKREETVRHVYSTFESYRDCEERADIEFKWKMVYDAYFGLKLTNDIFNYVIREVYRQVRTTYAQFMKVVFGGDELFHLVARQEGFDDKAEGAQAILHDLIERFGSDVEYRKAAENSILYGTGYTLHGWREYRQTQYKAQLKHGVGTKSEWERETAEVIQRAPTVESIPPWNVYSHPSIEDIRNSPMAFIYRGHSVADLKTMIRSGYIDRDATMEAIEAGGGSVIRNDSPIRRGHQANPSLDREEQVHEFLQCYDFNGINYVILDQKYLVRAMPLDDGKIPMNSYPNEQHPEQHWGQPDPILIVEEQKLLNEVMSLWVKSIWLALPRFKVKQGLVGRYDSQTLRPGGRLAVDNMDDIQMIETNQANLVIENCGRFIIDNMQTASGSTKEIAGTGSQQKTATGLVRLQDAATARFQDKIRQFVPHLRESIRSLYNLCARNCDQVYSLRVAGKDGGQVWKQYTPEVFTPDVDVKIEIGSGGGPEIAMQLMEGLKMSAGDPTINRSELWMEWFKATGMKNPKRFFNSPQMQQQDALKEVQSFLQTGIMTPPKPGDNHQLHVELDMMVMATPLFQSLPPEWQRTMQGDLATHQAYLQQMAEAQSAMAQQQMGPPAPGATQAGQEGNDRANAMFMMGPRGAAQQAPMPQNRGAA